MMRIDINQKQYMTYNWKYPFVYKKTILQDVHLLFPEGKTTLIIGTSGAGKSTLIKCLIGATSFDGKASGYDKRDIAYIPQHPALNLELSVYNTIRFNLWFSRLDGVNFQGLTIDELTQKHIDEVGLKAVSTKKCKNLSGGQMQRVSIAKELSRDKKIILADEIDTGLDCGVARYIIGLINDITHSRNLTTIVISHNLVNVDMYDNIIVLVKNSSKGFGQIAFSGSPSEAKDFFEVTEYVQILEKLNLAEEGGNGDLIIQETQERQVMYYINKFQRYRATKLQKK